MDFFKIHYTPNMTTCSNINHVEIKIFDAKVNSNDEDDFFPTLAFAC